jgi:hypothetical protein
LLGGCIIFDEIEASTRRQGKVRQKILFGVCILFPSFATTISATEIEENVNFQLRPRLCLLSEREAQCRDQVTAEWKSSAELSLCLYQEQQEAPIECWDNTTFGNTKFDVLLKVSTAFELRDPLTQKQHGREIFQVSYSQKKYPHPRRNPWSFF